MKNNSNNTISPSSQDMLNRMIHESAIWTSDIDYWIDEINSCQQLLTKIVPKVHNVSALKDVDHVQNMITYYGSEILLNIKSKVFHHRERMSHTNAQDNEVVLDQIKTKHREVSEEIHMIELRMKEFKEDFTSIKDREELAIDLRIPNLQNVLIPTDFSENAQRAIDYTLSNIGAGVQSITLLHVYLSPLTEISGEESLRSIVQEPIEKQFESALKRIKSLFPDLIDKVKTTILAGSLADGINSVVESRSIDLIVMGTEGAGKTSNSLFGSNTSKSIKQTTIPTLVVPKEAPILPPRKIALTTDLESDKAPIGIDLVSSLSKYFNASLRVIHVEPKSTSLESVHERKRIHEQLELLNLSEYELTQLQSSDIKKAINDYIIRESVDLLVTITRHGGLFHTLFSRSIALNMVLHSHTPILVLNGKK